MGTVRSLGESMNSVCTRNPRVSVLMPVRNAAETVEATIESILAQTFDDFEFIIIDDGSTDETAYIVDIIGRRDRRVKLVSRRHTGAVKALVDGSELARGRFIARMDADDVAMPERLELQVALLENHPETAVVGSRVEIVADRPLRSGMKRYERWINALVTNDQIVRELFVESPLPHPSVTLRRDAFRAVGGYRVQPNWPEDYDLWMRFWEAGYKMEKTAETLLRWRYSGASLSQTDERYSLENFRAVKIHYLLKTRLRNESREIMMWGAGSVGKRWLIDLGRAGMDIGRVVDVAPRKIGKKIHGARVIGTDEVPHPDGAFILCAVGAPGARSDIRNELGGRGYSECEDYLFVA